MHSTLCLMYFHSHSLWLENFLKQQHDSSSRPHREIFCPLERSHCQTTVTLLIVQRRWRSTEGLGRQWPPPKMLCFASLWTQPCHAQLTSSPWFCMTGDALCLRAPPRCVRSEGAVVFKIRTCTHMVWKASQMVHVGVSKQRTIWFTVHRSTTHQHTEPLPLHWIWAPFYFFLFFFASRSYILLFSAMCICICAYKVKPDCIQLPRARPEKTEPWQQS